MKKIAIIIGDIKYGGAERVAVYLANYLCSKGIEVILVSYTNNFSVYKLSENVNHVSLQRNKKYKKSSMRFASLTKNLRKCLLQIRPDLVLGMMSYNGVAASISLIGTGIPVVTSERTDPSSTTARTKFEKLFIKFVFNHFTKGLIFQTRNAQKYYSRRVQKKSVIIPNPLFEDQLVEVNRPERPTKRIISVGRLVEQKNYKMLILAFRRILEYYPDYTLAIFGEGNKRRELEDIIQKNDLNNKVFLKGETDKVFEEMNKADIFVLSSNYEGMPNALIEAMAMGMPVISTDCKGGGARYLIQDGLNGLLIPIGDQGALVNAMKKLIEERDFAVYLGKNALKIREKLNGDKICNEWYKNFLNWLNN